MTTDAAHSSLWRTADIYFGSSLISGLALNYYHTLNFGPLSGSTTLHMVGAPLLVIGSLVILYSKQALSKQNQPSEPGVATTTIIDSGMFSYSRNPLYTGLTLCYGGLSFAIDNAWLLALLPITLIAIQLTLIKPEERYLEQKFGDEYRAYKKRVRRWI
ncbi:MAG: isoprenylcysteine carboxylmethyltransferase family protein [Gammaproteobacteria bacterium]|nr:isoprenylcysteine carboxylmethyltransferase family protein [Gammaproteobacteria bacterium]